MINTRDLEYKDMRVAQREDIYFKKKAKKQKLMQGMKEAVEELERLQDKSNNFKRGEKDDK